MSGERGRLLPRESQLLSGQGMHSVTMSSCAPVDESGHGFQEHARKRGRERETKDSDTYKTDRKV